MSLPPHKTLLVPSGGTIAPVVLVIHVSQNNVGANVAGYNKTNADGYHWHWTFAQDGTAWRQLTYTQKGVHDAGINEISIGFEHAGFCEPSSEPLTDFAKFPAMLDASAQVAADFAHFIGKSPSRDWIIGHVEDEKWGGTSTHVDPGDLWPWDDYMDRVNKFYDAEEEPMGKANDYFEQLESSGLAKGQYAATLRFLWGYQRGFRGEALAGPDATDEIKIAGFEAGAKAKAHA